MDLLVASPLLITLVSAIVSVLFRRSRLAQRALALAGTAALLAAGVALLLVVWHDGIQATQMGDWPAPFGITLVADLFSAIMVTLAGLMGLSAAVYAIGTIDARREAFGFYALLHVLLMGVCGAFLTGDIFNLFVWFEVMLIASFVLLALGGEKGQIEGAIKYVTLNLISSTMLLTGIGIVYGMTGSLNMAELSLRLQDSPEGLVTTASMLFLVAFGIKAAAFPLYFWLPASYHTPPVAVSAIFAALLTKVGVYSMIRVFTLLFVQDPGYTHDIILVIAGATMVSGVLGAVAMYEFRRILSVHIVSQIGYIMMGLGFFTPLGIAGSIFFLIHIIIVKTALFFVSGIAHRLQGTFELKRMGGLYRTHPALAALFIIPAFSLAGLPPFSGFFAKLALVRAGLAAEQYSIVAVSLAVGMLTLLSMLKIWTEAFWKPRAEAGDAAGTPRLPMFAPPLALLVLTVAIGIAAGPIFGLATRAADQLLNSAEYRQVVLGDGP